MQKDCDVPIPTHHFPEMPFDRHQELLKAPPLSLEFATIATGTRHAIGVTTDGTAYSWGWSNAVGQLGRSTDGSSCSSKHPRPIPLSTKISRAFCSQGCSTGSGHSALLDVEGRLWMAGCDRWQQLGLGSVHGGSAGYTWIDGKLWQDRFVPSESVLALIQAKSMSIRDVALGGDHTMILACNQKDVYCFGKGGDGQLGLVGKPFVSAPIKSKMLSESGNVLLSAVCAFQNCSMTLDESGKVRNQAGKCRIPGLQATIQECVARAKHAGLIAPSKS